MVSLHSYFVFSPFVNLWVPSTHLSKMLSLIALWNRQRCWIYTSPLQQPLRSLKSTFTGKCLTSPDSLTWPCQYQAPEGSGCLLAQGQLDPTLGAQNRSKKSSDNFLFFPHRTFHCDLPPLPICLPCLGYAAVMDWNMLSCIVIFSMGNSNKVSGCSS